MNRLQIERVAPADADAVLSLLAGAMGRSDDPRFADLLRWKHERNPFGSSPAWVARAEGEVVGYRAFMRWEFTDGARTYRAARAVDTATHPAHQGKGIFRRLTLHGLDELRADGVDFVFNTPNDQSRPGYLKMGWVHVGLLRPTMRPRSPATVPAVLRGRVPAGHWGLPCDAGLQADTAFSDDEAVTALLDAVDAPGASKPAATASRLRTRRSAAFLRWRYDSDLLGYRVLTAGRSLADGVACFRLRRRGPAVEATIGDLLVPGGRSADRRRLVGRVLRETGADYALALGGSVREGLVPVPGQGPTLVWRDVCLDRSPPLAQWGLTMGDIELF